MYSDNISTFCVRFHCQLIFFMKLLKTNNIDVVKSCQSFFDNDLPSDLWARRNKKLDVTDMTFDKIFVHYVN